MRKICKGILQKKFLVLGLVMLSLAQPIHAEAAQGRITIHLKNSEGTGISGIEFQIFQVGVISDGQPEFYADFGIGVYPQTAEQIEEVVGILQRKITAAPLKTGVTDAKGVLEFNGAEEGVYFVMASPDNSYGEIMPFIVHLPYYEEVNGQMQGPGYQIEVEPKAEPKQGPGSVPPGDSQTSECPTVRIASSNPVKTGDTSRIGLYLCLMVSSALLILGIIMKGRTRELPGTSRKGRSYK